MVSSTNITNRPLSLSQPTLTWKDPVSVACKRLFDRFRSAIGHFEEKCDAGKLENSAPDAQPKRLRALRWLNEKQLVASPPLRSNAQDPVSPRGNVLRDEVGRLREICGAMVVTYDDHKDTPTMRSPIETIVYVELSKRSIIRQSDGTYNLYEHPNGSLFMTSIPLSLDQRTGIVSGVNPTTGTTVLIPPSAPILLQIGGADDGSDWFR